MKKFIWILTLILISSFATHAEEKIPEKIYGVKLGEKMDKAEKKLEKSPYKILPQSHQDIIEIENPKWNNLQFQLGWFIFKEEKLYAIEFLALFNDETDMYKTYYQFKEYLEQIYLNGKQTGNPDVMQFEIPGNDNSLNVHCFMQTVDDTKIYVMKARIMEKQ